MAQTRQIQLNGRVFATPSAVTVLVDGNETFSGQVGSGQPLDTAIVLGEFAAALPGDMSGNVTVPLSISVTSGVVSIGEIYASNYTTPAYPGPAWVPALGLEDTRSNILINGVAPEWPATPVDPMPGGTPSNPDWNGWCFELSAGETLTCNLTVVNTTNLPPS